MPDAVTLDPHAQALAPCIPVVGLKAQTQRLKPLLDARIAAVIEHGAFVNGPEIDELESVLAARAGVSHCVAVDSGTVALVIALMGEGVGAGDAVFVPTFTYMATASAVLLVGATPVFVDADERTFMIDPLALERTLAHIEREGRLRPRAVIPVDLFGLPADYKRIAEIADRRDLAVIADAAQSFGARQGGQPVGALAPITATSFFPTKPLSCFGDGGALFTDDDDRAARWRSLRAHGVDKDPKIAMRHGLNGRLDTLQAAVLLAKLTIFDQELAEREQLARRYDDRLAGVVRLPPRPADARSAWAIYSLLVDERDRVAADLAAAGVPTSVYYPYPLHRQPAYAHLVSASQSLPVAEELSRRIISLPFHPYLDEQAADRVCDALIAAIRG